MAEREQEEPAADREAPAGRAGERLTGRAEAAARIAQQHRWVELQLQRAMARGDFDDLPGAGKPIRDLGTSHDPQWWVKQLVEREGIAVLPPSVQLRKDDAELDGELDRLGSEREARALVDDFNDRVIAARYRPPEGPPLITMPRDVEETLAAWRERRAARRTTSAIAPQPSPVSRWRRWWHRR